MVISLFNQYQVVFYVFIVMDLQVDGSYDLHTSLMWSAAIAAIAAILFGILSYCIIRSLDIEEDASRSMQRIL